MTVKIKVNTKALFNTAIIIPILCQIPHSISKLNIETTNPIIPNKKSVLSNKLNLSSTN